MSDVPPEVIEFYESGRELGRLSDGSLAGPLEFERTTELLDRHVPRDARLILDVGGGPGTYAAWLKGRGHAVRLLDPVHRHVEHARALGIDAHLGEAGALPDADATADAVLLMGPLYHLTGTEERLRTLREARRVLRPGGVLIATAISRFAALLDQLIRLDRAHEPDELARLETITRTGVLPARDGGVFTTAFMHRPREFRDEVSLAGFDDVTILCVEGPGYLVPNFDERWSDPARRAALIAAARLIEGEPEIVGLGSHLMAIAS